MPYLTGVIPSCPENVNIEHHLYWNVWWGQSWLSKRLSSAADLSGQAVHAAPTEVPAPEELQLTALPSPPHKMSTYIKPKAVTFCICVHHKFVWCRGMCHFLWFCLFLFILSGCFHLFPQSYRYLHWRNNSCARTGKVVYDWPTSTIFKPC